MYKELNNCLKSYIPTNEELTCINDRFLSHKFIHSGDNLFGEKYEAWVYEYLKSWALQTSDVSSFIIKNSKLKSNKTDGLDYDKNGQIIYLKGSKKLAEFDGLFFYKDKVVFVESSVSELRQYYRRIEDKLLVKRDLLMNLFNTEEVYYLMITRPKKRSLVYRSLPNLILYKLKNPVFETLKSSNQVSYIKDDKFIDLNSISFSSFSS